MQETAYYSRYISCMDGIEKSSGNGTSKARKPVGSLHFQTFAGSDFPGKKDLVKLWRNKQYASLLRLAQQLGYSSTQVLDKRGRPTGEIYLSHNSGQSRTSDPALKLHGSTASTTNSGRITDSSSNPGRTNPPIGNSNDNGQSTINAKTFRSAIDALVKAGLIDPESEVLLPGFGPKLDEALAKLQLSAEQKTVLFKILRGVTGGLEQEDQSKFNKLWYENCADPSEGVFQDSLKAINILQQCLENPNGDIDIKL